MNEFIDLHKKVLAKTSGYSQEVSYPAIESRYALCVVTIKDENGKEATGIGEVSRDGKAVYFPGTLAYKRARINALREYLGDEAAMDIPTYEELPENFAAEPAAEQPAAPVAPAPEAAPVPETVPVTAPAPAAAAGVDAVLDNAPVMPAPVEPEAPAEEPAADDPSDPVIKLPKLGEIHVSKLFAEHLDFAKKVNAAPNPTGDIVAAQPVVRAYAASHGIVL